VSNLGWQTEPRCTLLPLFASSGERSNGSFFFSFFLFLFLFQVTVAGGLRNPMSASGVHVKGSFVGSLVMRCQGCWRLVVSFQQEGNPHVVTCTSIESCIVQLVALPLCMTKCQRKKETVILTQVENFIRHLQR
jgi:hypothetical protein